MTAENDIVLIHYEDTPAGFARIESIEADHKPDWYHVKLLLLQIPLQTVTWILREAYINGGEYTMGGNRMRLEKVICPEDPGEPTDEKKDPPPGEKTSNVISLKDLRK